MRKIIKFYDLIFLYHYNRLKNHHKEPEVVPIVLITLCQTFNIMLLYIVGSYFLGLNKYLSIPNFFLILCGIIAVFNIYYFSWKNRYDKISDKYTQIPSRIDYVSGIYFILSLIATFILIYFFNEFGDGFIDH